MTITEQLSVTDLAYGTFRFSVDGKVTWYEVPGISTFDIPESVPSSTPVNYLKGTVKRPSKASPPDLTVGISVYQPQREWARKWVAAAVAQKTTACEFLTQQNLEYDSGAVKMAVAATGVVTFSAGTPDLSDVIPGLIVKVGSVIRVIEEVDPDANTMKVSAVSGAPTIATAAIFKVYEPSMKWQFSGKPSHPGFTGGADAPVGASSLTVVPRAFIDLPEIVIPT